MKRFLKVLSLSFFVLVFSLPVFVFAQGGDPLESLQWYLEKIKAPQAWELTTGDKDVVVAILDTGIDMDHSDIKENIWVNSNEVADDGLDNDNNGYVDDVNGWNFLKADNTIEPDISWGFDQKAIHHGTFVSGIVSAIHNNGEGIKGITSNVKIMTLVTMNAYGYGDSYPVAEAINYAVDNGADVINLSFGGYTHSTALKNAIRRAYENNVVVVASAGNEGFNLTNYPVYPICYDNEWEYNEIIGVGSVNQEDQVSAYSNYGEGCVDLFAPGENITSLAYLDDFNSNLKEAYIEQWEGTSFAAPLVTGTVALMKSVNPSLTVAKIINILNTTSNFLEISKEYGSNKRLNIYNSVMEAAKLEGGNKYKDSSPILITSEVNDSAVVNRYNLIGDLLSKENVLGGVNFKGLNINKVDENYSLDLEDKYVVGVTEGAMPFVRVISRKSQILSSFLAFENNFKSGVTVAAGDLDNDGVYEIIAAPQKDKEPIVKVFNNKGQLKFSFLAFEENFKNGLNLAIGDVIGDGQKEIIVVPRDNHSPEIKIFNNQGKYLKTVNAFIPQFKGGVNLSLGDINRDGIDDIIVGAGQGGGPQIQVFEYSGKLISTFFAYDKNFRSGVKITTGDVDEDGNLEIIAGSGAGVRSWVQIFNLRGQLEKEFFPMAENYLGGINLTVL